MLKVYMKNQLDLQESEWETYEETFNAIAEKLEETEEQLEKVTMERDALLEEKETWASLRNDFDFLSEDLKAAEQVALCAKCTKKTTSSSLTSPFIVTY